VWAHLPEPHQPYLAGPRPVDYGKEDIDLYDSSIRFVDGELERIAAFALGPARSDETVLIIHGDHGQAFMEHGTRTHGRSVYQEETRVPLLLFGPGIGSRRVDSPVSLIDVAPTILDLAGLPPNGALCGDSLLPAIRGAGAKPDRDVFIGVLPDSKQGASILALVRGAYKIVVFPKTGRQQLYDIAADPLERRDLAAEEPAKLEEMKEALESYQRAHGMDVVNVD
jgi:arylsulfatase A-like enzyme